MNENMKAGMARVIIIMKTTLVRQCIKFENLFFNLTVINHVASVSTGVCACACVCVLSLCSTFFSIGGSFFFHAFFHCLL